MFHSNYFQGLCIEYNEDCRLGIRKNVSDCNYRNDIFTHPGDIGHYNDTLCQQQRRVKRVTINLISKPKFFLKSETFDAYFQVISLFLRINHTVKRPGNVQSKGEKEKHKFNVTTERNVISKRTFPANHSPKQAGQDQFTSLKISDRALASFGSQARKILVGLKDGTDSSDGMD